MKKKCISLLKLLMDMKHTLSSYIWKSYT